MPRKSKAKEKPLVVSECGKINHPTFRSARRAITNLDRANSSLAYTMIVYFCSKCNSFHIGHDRHVF